jgi:hypothetical protein
MMGAKRGLEKPRHVKFSMNMPMAFDLFWKSFESNDPRARGVFADMARVSPTS